MNVNDLDINDNNNTSNSTNTTNTNQQSSQQSPNSRKSTSKKRKLDDLCLENISDSENCPSKFTCICISNF
jgi:hypothetical protein